MDYLRKHFPVLFSPKFWGILLYSVLGYMQAKGWLSGVEMEYLTQLVAMATGVGVADSLVRKLGPQKKKK